MASQQQTLTKLKVTELKARCKELKIPNFSKLSKTDLIAKILEATTDTAQSETTHPDAACTSKTDDKTSSENPVKPKERKKSDPKRKDPKRKVPKDGDESANTPNKRPKTGADGKGGVRNIATMPMSTLPEEIAARNRDSSVSLILAAVSSPRPPRPPVLSGPADPVIRPPNVNKKQRVASVVPRPRFKPLTVVGALKPVSRPEPLNAPAAVDLGSASSRIQYIKSHFVNDLLTQLYSHRIRPIVGPPYPIPAGFPKSLTAELAFQGLHPELYTTSTPEAFRVALRFWIARLHSSLQLGSGEAWSAQAGGMGVLGPDISTWPPITACTCAVGDIWAITTNETGKQISYLVIGVIGEVIGHSRRLKGDEEGLVKGCQLRGDWARYVQEGGGRELSALVKSKDPHGFPGGISKAWRAKQSDTLVKVAERAVLASCALNSFSGDKMSATEMDAIWLGRPGRGGQATCANVDLDIYLPEMSQVVSVHLPSTLHPALAIVHRASGYSEYVLAETGQMVGTEDEGVVELWQGLLGCDYKGVRNTVKSSSFWEGWESRVKAGII